jgi:hypothetical protein
MRKLPEQVQAFNDFKIVVGLSYVIGKKEGRFMRSFLFGN